MHLRIIDVEGTPEEIAALPQLSEVLGLDLRQETDDGGGLSHGPAPATDSVARQSELPANVVSVLRRRRPATEIYRLSVAFLAEVLGWPDVDARVGVSRRTDDGMANAIRLHCRGSPVAAFTYLRLPAGPLTFRLPVVFS